MSATPQRIGLVLALGGLLVVLDTTVTTVLIAPVAAAFGAGLPTIGWITTGYLLGVVAVIPLAGWAATRLGERRTYLWALAIFTAASVLVALAWDPESLIAFRVVQGLAGGLLNPVGQAIGLHAVPRQARGRMMSLLGLPVVVGPVLGPLLAGLLTDAASWRWVFVINLPLGVATMVLCLRVLPAPSDLGQRETPPERSRPQVAWFQLGQISGGSVLLVLGCTLLGEAGRPTPTAVVALLAGVVLLATFVGVAWRASHPIVQLKLLRRRPFAAAAGVLMCFGAAYFGSATILPIYVQAVRGDSAALAGTLTIPMGLAVGLTLQVATRLVDRIAPSRIVAVGTALGAVGCGALLWATTGQASYPVIGAAAVILGVGSGATLMPTMTVALRDLEGDDTADGTTLLALLQQLAGALGVALVATALTLAVRSRVPGLHGGGIDAMIDLPAERRLDLAAALSSAVGSAYLVGVVLCAASLIAALLGLRRLTSAPRHQQTQAAADTKTGAA